MIVDVVDDDDDGIGLESLMGWEVGIGNLDGDDDDGRCGGT